MSSDSDQFTDIRNKATEAAKRAMQCLAQASEQSRVKPGNLYVFPVDLRVALEWLVVRRNRDDAELWYVVGADQNPLVGSSDVEVPSHEDCGALVLRCGQGFWVHSRDLSDAKCVGALSEDYVAYARDRLSSIVQGTTIVSDEAALVDIAPDYEDWIEDVSSAASQLEQLFHTPPQVVSLADFRSEVVEEREFSLAAASAKAVDEKVDDESAKQAVIADGLPGTLRAFLYTDSVVLVYEPSADEQPLRLTSASGIDVKSGEWSKDVNGSYLWSQELPIVDGKLTLRCFGETFTIE